MSSPSNHPSEGEVTTGGADASLSRERDGGKPGAQADVSGAAETNGRSRAGEAGDGADDGANELTDDENAPWPRLDRLPGGYPFRPRPDEFLSFRDHCNWASIVTPSKENVLYMPRNGLPSSREVESSRPDPKHPFAPLRLVVSPYTKAEFEASSKDPKAYDRLSPKDYLYITGNFILLSKDEHILVVHVANMYGRMLRDDAQAQADLAELGEWMDEQLSVRQALSFATFSG
ncbi:hypothetical protein OF846_000738 [Rhodotorula toruloides]|nr:hypothetical protein OF846_000738 [Rhodotorula toruloides]